MSRSVKGLLDEVLAKHQDLMVEVTKLQTKAQVSASMLEQILDDPGLTDAERCARLRRLSYAMREKT